MRLSENREVVPRLDFIDGLDALYSATAGGMASVPTALALVFAGLVASGAGAGTFPDARSQPPAEWKGPVFRLSQDYPKTLPFPEALAFFDIDFKREPAAYLHAVLAYVLEGNLTSGKPNAPWAIQDNPVRTWYHAPWMHSSAAGSSSMA
jgi:hypothetical protein